MMRGIFTPYRTIGDQNRMSAFKLTFTTSRRREITISKAMDQKRATIIGLDPETGHSAEEARELAALFAGMRRLLEG